MSLLPVVNISLACLPALRHDVAVQRAIDPLTGQCLLSEGLWGKLSANHVQLVPQCFGTVDEALCEWLLSMYAGNQFRLHANVNVTGSLKVVEISEFHLQPKWVNRAGEISKRLRAPAYSAHSGRRAFADMNLMLDNARRAADAFGAPVAVEGQYPSSDDRYLVSSWDEYRTLFESGVPYALDLSHLNILATSTGRRKDGLVAEMLSCERCIEVHVSDNDGTGDWHQMTQEANASIWWLELLRHIHRDAVVFTEGNQIHQRLPAQIQRRPDSKKPHGIA